MSNLKTMVRGAYSIQKLRIQMGNRIVANFKAKLGQKPSKSEDELDIEAKEVLKTLRRHFSKMIDGIKHFPRRKDFKGDEVISDFTELCLISQYTDLETSEEEHFKRLGEILQDYPIYIKFLEPINGIGPAMAGVIISEIDINKAKYPSSLWRYAGLDVAQDGRGRSRKAEHLIEVEYVNSAGEMAVRNSITFNLFLKTKLMGVLAGSFLRAGRNDYCYIYYDYKNRLEQRQDLSEESKGHRHNMAIRYMIKMFLLDLYIAWRKIEGLAVSVPYYEAKLNLKHEQRLDNRTKKTENTKRAKTREKTKPLKRAKQR